MQELQEYIVPADASVKSDLSMKDFGKIWRRRKKLIGYIVGITFILCLALSLPPMPHRSYAESAVVLIQRVPSNQMNAQESYAAPWMEQVDTPLDMIQTPQAYQIAVDWMKSEAIATGHPIPPFDQSTYPKRVSVANTKGSNTIDITAWDWPLDSKNPKYNAFALADAAAQSFVAWKTQQAQNDVKVAIASYRQKADQAKTELALAQDRETRFKEQFQVADLDTEERNTLDLMSTEQNSLLTAEQADNAAHAKLVTLEGQLSTMDRQIAAATGVRDDSTVQQIQSELISAETDRSTMALHYTKLFPNKLPDIDQRIADYKAQLAAAVQGTMNNQRPSLQDQDATLTAYRQQQVDTMDADAMLTAARNGYNQLFSQHNMFPARDLEYIRLDQDVQVKTALYQTLYQALNQAIADESTITGDVEMTSPTQLVEFNQLQYSILFAVVGLLLGSFIAACWVLLLEQMDTRLYQPDEVRRLLSGPVVGSIAELSRKERQALSQGIVPNTLVDVFNVTRNNLQLVMRHYTQEELWDHQVVMFASAGPDEGKSMIASQIARSIAQAGHSVLFVDANLRPDKERLSLSPRTPDGLAQVLSEGADLDSLIVESQVPNLSILPSGASNGHTTDLVSMATMPETIKRLRSKAEVIIIDTPACALATDALYIAPYTDAVLQVIAMGGVDETVLADTVAAIQAASPKVVGYVLNRTPRPKRKGARFHHYALELNGFNTRATGSMLNGAAAPMLTGAPHEPVVVASRTAEPTVASTSSSSDDSNSGTTQE